MNHRVPNYVAFFMGLALVLGMSASSVQASISLTLGSYNVQAQSSDPGLVVETAKLLTEPYSFNLAVGEWISVPLFEIWTNETANNPDDSVGKPISVDFSFTEPKPDFGGSVDGETSAVTGFIIIVPYSAGAVDWDGSTYLNFGPNGDGLLKISLSDEVFNGGLLDGFRPGREHGATVNAKFKLLAEPTAVPEASSILVWSVIGLAVGLVAYRHQKRTA